MVVISRKMLFAIAEKRMECWDCEAESCEGCDKAEE